MSSNLTASAMVFKTEWTIDERPVYGPKCPGYFIHKWTLLIEEGSIFLGSGCTECDFSIEIEAVTAEFTGKLTFEHEHGDGRCPNAIRMLPCDCNYWYHFEIEG